MRNVSWAHVTFLRAGIACAGMIGRGTVGQSVTCTVVAFVFFAITFRYQPFIKPGLNRVKLFTEFQIFGILLVCTVLQAYEVDLLAEVVTVDDYGMILQMLIVAMIPVTIYVLCATCSDLEKDAALARKEGQASTTSKNRIVRTFYKQENALDKKAMRKAREDTKRQEMFESAGQPDDTLVEFSNPIDAEDTKKNKKKNKKKKKAKKIEVDVTIGAGGNVEFDNPFIDEIEGEEVQNPLAENTLFESEAPKAASSLA